jgi:uncharacterized protein (TIGR02099 family)
VLSLKAALRPPPGIAQSLILDATTQGPIEDPSQWQVDWSGSLNGLRADFPWLQRQLAEGNRLELQDARFNFGGQWLKGQLTALRGEVIAASIRGQRGNHTLTQLRDVQISGTAQHNGDSWMLALAPIRLNSQRGSWPANQWQARLHLGTGGIDDVEVSGDFLRLDDLLGWLALTRQPSAWAGSLASASGEMRDIRLQWSPPDPVDMDVPGQASPRDHFHLEARFSQLGMASVDEHPGVAGLSGSLTASAIGGTVTFDPVPLTLTLPTVMETPVLLDSLSGPLHWEQEAGGWQLSSSAFDFRLDGTQASGHFDLRLPRAEAQSPAMDLQLDFQSEDAAALKPLMPKTWGPNTKAWLRRAIQHAPIPHGHLDLSGPLADFPYVEHPSGHWSLDISIGDGLLAFAPDWAPLDHLKARVLIEGRTLNVDAESAVLGGASIDQIHAQIPDFHGEQLTVDGQAHGDAKQFYAVLRSSLKQTLAGLLNHTDAAGDAQLALHLNIPLSGKASEIAASGTVALDKVRLDVKGLDEPIRNVSGKLAFGGNGITADALQAQFYELPLSARIIPDPASPEGRVAIEMDAPMMQPGSSNGGVMAHYLPDWILHRLDGQAHWSASLPLSGKESGVLTLGSDLKGVSSDLPPPLAKKADDSRPITLRISGDDAAPLRLLIGLPDGRCTDACIALRFAEIHKALQLRGIEGHFGSDLVPQAVADGIVVTGHPQALDIAEWLGLFGSEGGNGSEVPAMRRLDLSADSLVAGDYRIRATHLLLVPSANPGNGWTLTADGDGAKGSLAYLPANGGQLRGNFEHLHLEPIPSPATTDNGDAAKNEDQDHGRALEPTRVPTLDVSVDHVESARVDLGHFRLATSRIANGQSIDSLRLDGGVLTLDSHGSWRRATGLSSGDNRFEIESKDFGAALKALGYAPSITGHTAKVGGQLQWTDRPQGLDFREAAGTVKLEVDNGFLTTVDPGASRVLGLFNLYALPRRLTLNFSDVVSKGLGFDKLLGTFKLGGGNAMTDDMRISAPSLRMEIHGRVGLVARDYDEHVTVYPGLSTGAAIGVGLAGGPAGVAIALVAQQLFGKPLETLTRFSYHLTGSWDNPQIKRGESETVATPAPAPSGDTPSASPPPATSGDKAG